MEPSNSSAIEKFQAELQRLKDAFARSLPARTREVEALWTALGGNPTAAAIRALERALHSLAGSGATFGFPEVSRCAKSLENALRPLVDDPPILSDETMRHLGREWESLRQAMDAPRAQEEKSWLGPEREASFPSGNRLRPILAVDNADIVAAVKEQLRHSTIEAQFLAASDQENLLRLAPGAIVVLECDFSPEQGAFLETLGRRCRETGGALFVVSARGDAAARLAAVRAGVAAYFSLPLKVDLLLDRLDQYVLPESVEPPRVLIVDDEEPAARYAEHILQSCGMLTRVQTSPLLVLDDLEAFSPDCLLMDVYMPQCDGPELAKVIRQIEDYMSIPIVFLSMEQDIAKQVAAVAQGGDDFILKPVDQEHLVGMLRERIRRYCLIRSLMTHDGLTGLLNHTNLKLRLASEIDRAKRLGSGLAFAMIDIDHFKAVNDTYGHTAGDSVIRNLSHFLQRRLRRSDVLGRYGGEEFGVALTDLAEPRQAVVILDTLRREFAEMPHSLGEATARVTFSCGVAFCTGAEDAEQLCTLADTALYESKHRGRNCVSVYGQSV